MKPRVYGVLLGLGLVGCATGCSAGVYGAAAGAGGGPSESATVTTAARTPTTLSIRVPGGGTVKRTWSPYLHSQLTLASHPHRSGGRILLALETTHEPFGTYTILVAKPSRGSRYELGASVRGNANLSGRTVLLQLSVYDTHGLVNFAATRRRLSSGWQRLSVHGRVPIAGGHDLRVAIYLSRPTGPPSWLEIRGVSASGVSLTK